MKRGVIIAVAVCLVLAFAAVYSLIFGGDVISNYRACHNGIKDSAEEGIDCGGTCRASCVEYEEVRLAPPGTNVCVGGVPNGILQTGEECDGNFFGAYDGMCSNYSSSFTGGTLNCNSNCQIGVVACTPGICGDGICQARRETHFDCPQDCTGSYYIVDKNNPSCSDTGLGNIANPFCHIDASFSKLAPDVTVYLRGGKQTFFSTGRVDVGGTPGNFVTFRNYPGESPIVDSGTKVSPTWTQDLILSQGKPFSVWYADGLLGAYSIPVNPELNPYPYKIVQGINNPLSRFVSLSNFTSIESISGVDGTFDGYYINCSNGRTYLRFYNPSLNPNNDEIYFIGGVPFGGTRLEIRASYVNVIGLTFQHSIDGIKMNPPPSPQTPLYRQVTQYVGVYDNVIRSLPMGIADHAQNESGNNYFTFENNTFLNIGSEVELERDGSEGRDVRCESELFSGGNPLPWRYVYNRWEHAIYGSAYGSKVVNNFVNLGGHYEALGMNRDGIYFGNKIIDGNFNSYAINASVYNNIVVNKLGVAFAPAITSNSKFYNNLFAGRGSIAVFGTSESPNSNASFTFVNNVLVNMNSEADSYCAAFYNINNYTNLDMDYNAYVGCGSFQAINDLGVYQSYNTPNSQQNFNNFRALTKSDGNSSLTALQIVNSLFGDFYNGNYSLKLSGILVDAGRPIAGFFKDLDENKRPVDVAGVGFDLPVQTIYDIGPYEYQQLEGSSGGGGGGGGVTISACGTISQNGTYVLNQSLTTTGTCFTIRADNVTLDGNQFSIIGDRGENDNGVQIIPTLNSNYSNIKIKNLNISGFGRGILAGQESINALVNNLSIRNNNFFNNNLSSITINGRGLGNSVIDNLIFDRGVDLSGVLRTNVSNNIFNSIVGIGSQSAILISLNSEGSYISNNIVIGSNIGFLCQQNTKDNVYFNNTLNSNNIGIYFDIGCTNASVSGGIISNSRGDAIVVEDFSNNNVFSNISITGTNLSSRDFVTSTSIEGTNLVDMPHIGNYSFAAGSKLSVKNSQFGEIKFLQSISGSGNNLSRDISIKDNFAEVRSDLNSGLNASANITFYGIGNRASNPRLLRNGVLCGDVCYNFTALNATNVVFNVTSWTNYSIEGVAPIVTFSCSDGVQNQGEAGVDCGGPCSACPTTGGPGGGSGGGGGPSLRVNQTICQPNWSCYAWSACDENNLRRRVCYDLRACNTTLNKPYEIEACDEENSVINLGGEADDENGVVSDSKLKGKLWPIVTLIVIYILVLILLITLSLRKKAARMEFVKKMNEEFEKSKDDNFRRDNNFSVGSTFGGNLR